VKVRIGDKEEIGGKKRKKATLLMSLIGSVALIVTIELLMYSYKRDYLFTFSAFATAFFTSVWAFLTAAAYFFCAAALSASLVAFAIFS